MTYRLGHFGPRACTILDPQKAAENLRFSAALIKRGLGNPRARWRFIVGQLDYTLW